MSERTSLLVIIGFLAAACSPNTPPAGSGANTASTDSATVRAAIEAANARFLDAFKRGDKAGLMAGYAADAVLMMPNEEAWRGREGLDKGFADVMVAGDLAVETGTF
jgi:ketosteroid isomerase-like protein